MRLNQSLYAESLELDINRGCDKFHGIVTNINFSV